MGDIADSEKEWLESPQGRRCLDPGILKKPSFQASLQDRIRAAFLAGVASEQKLMAKHLRFLMKR